MMNARWLFISSALVLLFANGAYADGAYQRTRDGKTFVWNNDPKPHDEATWSGQRDPDGYATGPGALTWYRAERKIITGSNIPWKGRPRLISRCSGKMVRGKLDGPVVIVDARGKTFHGAYVVGRKGRHWAPGPLPPGPIGTGIAPEQQHDEQVAREEVAQAEPEVPAEGLPPIQSAEVSRLRQATASQGSQRSASGSVEPTARREITDRPANQRDSGPAVTKTSTTDDSLRSLTSPPSSLRVNATAEALPQVFVPTTASAPPARPHLTEAEVIELANAEAHRQGYNLGEYQRPQADYAVADETWSVSYDQKDADGGGKHFSVSVEDKTKEASIVVGR